jgi:hypothetical protein
MECNHVPACHYDFRMLARIVGDSSVHPPHGSCAPENCFVATYLQIVALSPVLDGTVRTAWLNCPTLKLSEKTINFSVIL